MGRDRPGVALVLALVVVFVVTTLGLAILAAGAREMALAGALDRHYRARATAESAARVAADTWSSRRYRGLVVGAEMPSGPGPGDGAAVTVARLDSTLFLIRSAATLEAGRLPSATARVGLLVRTLDPAELARLLPAAVTADSVVVADSGVVDTGPCAGASDPAAALRAPEVHLGAAAAIAGDPPVDIRGAIRPLPPFLRSDRVERLATATVGPGAVTPRSSAGECVPDGLNWGGIDAGDPCHDFLPLIVGRGPLVVEGGEGRGALIVEGDVDLRGVRFSGAVLASGRITIGPGTAVWGAVRGDVVRILGGRVTRDRCALEAGLTAGGMDGAFAPGDRRWVPLF